MKIFSKLQSPLLTPISFNYSLFTRQPKKCQFTLQSPPIQIRGMNYLHQLIMKGKQLQYIPIYLKYYHKFAHKGICKKTNYWLYQQTINIFQRKMQKRGQQEDAKSTSEEEKEGEDQKDDKFTFGTNDKNTLISFTIAMACFSLLPLILHPKKKDQDQIPKTSSQKQPSFAKQQELPPNINQQTLINKLFQGLKSIHIKEKTQDKGTDYIVTFEYQDKTSQKFSFLGNINNLLKMVQKHENGKFERTKIILERNQKNIFNFIFTPITMLLPFMGIAFTIWIFKKINPDAIISAISPKKSYKIQAQTKIKVKFDDVAGMEQAKKEITQFVDFLKYSGKYQDIGAKIPKGALLTGPPGTGKTMLAKATAGEAGVPFFYISGSEFVQIFVGMGASKVRQLFSRARASSPSIIFIDEIDAIGRKRQSSRNQEKDSTLNQLLVQMDGFGSKETVIVLAATNRKDTLDNALIRPGRFDRLVEVTLPDIKAREEIFKVHLKPLKVDPNKQLNQIAKRLSELTPGFSGADIANLCNQAAIIAIRKGKSYVQDKDFQDASERITAGYEKKGLAKPETRKRVAYHEAGHAIAGWFLKGGDPLVKLTIIPRSKGALGYAQYLPKSSYIITKNSLIDRIAIMLGGITSEEMHFDQVSSGASDDLQKVYDLSRRMVAQFGMGRRTYNVTIDEQSHVRKESQSLSKKIDEEMMELVKEAQQRCRQVLGGNKEVLAQLAEKLLQKQTINSEDIKSILGERPKFD